MTSRRRFLERIGALSAYGALSMSARSGAFAGYGYAGSLGADGHDSIEAFRVDSGRWTRIQQAPCRAPVCLILHPNRPVLYVANAVALHEGLPRGTVEVFSIDLKSGALSRLQRRGLSLSGTEPRSLAVSPDGRHLAVAIYGGGAYNVLAIERDGTLGQVRHIFKEVGCGAHPELPGGSASAYSDLRQHRAISAGIRYGMRSTERICLQRRRRAAANKQDSGSQRLWAGRDGSRSERIFVVRRERARAHHFVPPIPSSGRAD